MTRFTIRNATTGATLATARRADTLLERTIGLLRERDLAPSHGLFFERCAAIHTIGMRFPIDVVFLDRDARVLQTRANVRPNCFSVTCRKAYITIELGSGTLARSGVRVGDVLSFHPENP